jgi:hypothetical protein
LSSLRCTGAPAVRLSEAGPPVAHFASRATRSTVGAILQADL